MLDVAPDSERHAQAYHDVYSSGQEPTAPAVSANVLVMTQIFEHWTTENAAQDMGETVHSFPTAFPSQMAHGAQFVGDVDVKVNQAAADFEGIEEGACAVMAAVSAVLPSPSQGKSIHKVYSQETINKLTGENKPKDDTVQGDEHESEQQETSNIVGQTPSHDEPGSY